MNNHVHIGAGALGLGLIVPQMAKTSTTTTVFNRRPILVSTVPSDTKRADAERKKYKAKLEKCEFLKTNTYYQLTMDDALANQKIDRFYYLDEGFPDNLEGEYCIITTSVKDGMLNDDFLINLYDIIQSATVKHEAVLVISCENRTRSQQLHDKLNIMFSDDGLIPKSVFSDSVHFKNALVDRVCQAPKIDKNGVLSAKAEMKYEFWIEDSQLSQIIDPATAVLKSKNELDEQYVKKIILLNLSHALIATWALKRGYASLDIYLNREDEGKMILFQILNELSNLIMFQYPDMNESELERYFLEVQDRFVRENDPISRIIERFHGPGGISSFFKDIWFKGLQHFDELEFESLTHFPTISASIIQLIGLIAEDNYIDINKYPPES